MRMSSEDRARKFWNDWYNGDHTGDLHVGDTFVGDDDVTAVVALIAEVQAECARLCESQAPKVDDTGNGDEYRRGHKRAALDCAAIIRRAPVSPKAPR